MKLTYRTLWTSAFLLAGLCSAAAHAQRGDWPGRADRDWLELGCQRVSFRVDADVVRVGRHEGRFKAIRAYARGGDVEMLNVRVIYSNGQPDDLPIRHVLRRGDRTRPLDLLGWQRSIDRIELVYRALPNYRGRDAVICIEGLSGYPSEATSARDTPARELPRGDDRAWEELGCQQVALFGHDHDSIHVGRHEGHFRAVRLFVRGADVELLNLAVIYYNGAPDEIPVRRYLREGERSPAFDLRGHRRPIEHIDLVYRNASTHRGMATVCVEGLP